MSQKRLNNLSILRICLMTIVVWFHCIAGYTTDWTGSRFGAFVVPYWDSMYRFISCFHMPVFVMLSGYLYSRIRSWGGIFAFKNSSRKKSYAYCCHTLFGQGLSFGYKADSGFLCYRVFLTYGFFCLYLRHTSVLDSLISI